MYLTQGEYGNFQNKLLDPQYYYERAKPKKFPNMNGHLWAWKDRGPGCPFGRGSYPYRLLVSEILTCVGGTGEGCTLAPLSSA